MRDFETTRERIEQGRERGFHLGVQAYVSVDGEPVLDEAIGLARRGDGEQRDRALKRDDWVLWMSATKPVGAVAAAQLWEQGKLDLDAPVAETIPEFAQGGKEAVTMRHILMHTSGFREADIAFVEPDWDVAVAKACAAPLEEGWIVGETAGYHPRTSWYVLGEMVRRIDGRDYPTYVREEIFEPLGMDDCWIGMPEQVYRANAERIAPIYATQKGEPKLTDMTSEANLTACFPAGNGCGPMRQLGRFYEALLNGGKLDGARILNAETVAEFTRPHRVGTYDETFRHKMDWGLGFIVDSKHHGLQTVPYGYGDHASPRTFGHGGRQTVSAFADPDARLVCCIHFNGMPGEPRHNQRARQDATALYEDLGLDG